MMTKGKKRGVGVLAVAMAVSLAAGVALGLPGETQTASAYRGNDDQWVNLTEIYNDSTSKFKAGELRKLYQALAGSAVTTLEGLESAMTSSGDSLTSKDFRNSNDNKNVCLYFGGMKWDAAYLTTAKNSTGGGTQAGDIILDLWRSTDMLTSADDASYADWASPTNTYTYPSSMYSTSKVRVVTLNAGGQYSLNRGESLSEKQEQDPDNKYARFTMSSVSNSLTAYIAKPSEVGYQAKEFDATVAMSDSEGINKYYCPNDAYEAMTEGNEGSWKWYDDNMDYLSGERDSRREDGAKYGSWKDDYLWLPSMTEAGRIDGESDGIWDTDSALRSSTNTLGSTQAWLRSGSNHMSNQAFTNNSSGGGVGSGSVGSSYRVRPALHLNLTAAARNAEETAETVTAEWVDGAPTPYYTTGADLTDDILADIAGKIEVKKQDGSALAYESDYTLTVNGGSEVVNSGSYSVTVMLNDPSYQFDGSGATFELSQKITVEDAAATVETGGKTTGYGSIETAWTAAKDAGSAATVKLMQDVQITATLEVEADDDITLDLNGKTLTMTGTGSVLSITAGSLTLTDSDSTAANGTEIKDPTVTSGSAPNLAIQGGLITGGNKNYGGGVTIDGGTFIMEGGTIAGNTATTSGAGIYGAISSKGSTITMKGGAITGNKATQDAGGVYARDCDFTMTGGTITKNYAGKNGGGIYLSHSSHTPSFTMQGGSITGNVAASQAGGAEIDAGTFTLYADANISDNKAGGSTSRKDSNITLSGGGKITLGDKFSSGKKVGVSKSSSVNLTKNPNFGVFTTNFNEMHPGENPADYFQIEHINDSDANFEILATADGEGIIGTPVASVTVGGAGAVKYATIDDAWTVAKRASSAATVTLLATTTASGALEVGADDNITLDLGSYTLTGNITVSAGSFALSGNGTLTGGVTVGGGTFTMTGGTITNKAGSGVSVSGGQFEMSGGAITECAAENGGGVSLTGGTFTMSSAAKITGNTATASGGGVYIYGGTFTMEGGTISDNKAPRGAGVYKDKTDTFTMSGGTISGNTAEQNGGGVEINAGTFAMTNGTITGNRANDGAGVYVGNEDAFTMSGGASITGNTATASGGGVYLTAKANFTMTGGTITENTAADGPDVYMHSKGTDGTGAFTWGGGEIGIVYLGTGAFITVQNGFSALTGGKQISIVIQGALTDDGAQVLSWTGADPTANFKSADDKACFFTKGSGAAYIGKHSLTCTAEWSGYTSVKFTVKCDHTGCEKESGGVTLESGRISSSQTKAPTCTQSGTQQYTATLELSDLTDGLEGLDAQHATLNGATATTEETLSATGHNWSYSADQGGKSITATCEHEHTEADGAKTFTITLNAPTQTTYNGTTIEATVTGNTTEEPFTGEKQFTLTYKYNKTAASGYTNLTDNGGKPKNAGYYEVTLTAGGETVTLEFEIGKAEITLTWSGNDVGYTYTYGASQAPSAEIASGTQGTDVLTVTIEEDGGKTFKNADTYNYTATLVGAAAENYTVSNDKQTYTINKATITLPDPAQVPYNGEVQLAKELATLTGVNGETLTLGTDYTVTYKGKNGAGTPQNADTYTVTVALETTDTANNYTLKNDTVTYTINQVSVTAEWKEGGNVITERSDLTYDGTTHTVTLTLTADGYTTTVELTGNNTYKNAGAHTFTATDESGNFTQSKWTLTITVKQAELHVDVSGSPKTYNGAVQEPTITVTGVAADGALSEGDANGYSVTYAATKDGELSGGKPMGAGTYSITFTLKGDAATNYKQPDSETFTIGKAKISISGTYTDSREYNGEVYSATVTGSSHELTVAMDTEDDRFQITITTDGKDARDTAYTGTIQAGDVEYDDANFELVIDPAAGYSVTITKKVLQADDVHWSGTTFEYNGEAQKPEATIDGVKEEHFTLEVEVDGDAINANTEGTHYTATAKLPGTATNYTLEGASTTFTITKRRIRLSLDGDLEHTYGSARGSITASATHDGGGAWYGTGDDDKDLNDNLDFTFKKDGAGVAQPYTSDMGAGNYAIVAQWKGESALKNNYEIVNEETGTTYTVNKAKLTVKANDQTITYGEAPSLTNDDVTITGFVNGEGAQQDSIVRGDVEFDCNYKQYDDVGDGSFDITPSIGSLTADNYEFDKFDGGTLTVNKAKLKAKITPSKSFTYGDQIELADFGVTFDTLVGEDDGKVTAELTFGGTAYNGTDVSGTTPPQLAGEGYTVKVSGLTGDKAANYELDTAEGADGETTFDIAKQTVANPTPTKADFTYDGTQQAFTFQNNDGTKYTVTGDKQTDANEDGYEVKVTLRDDKNYQWATPESDPAVLTYKFIIHKKQIAVEWTLKDWTGDSHAFEDKKFTDPTASAYTGLDTDEHTFTLLVVRTSPGAEVEFKNVGSYTFEASFDPNDAALTKNYTLTVETKTKTYEITAATNNEWLKGLSLNGWTYDAGTGIHNPTATPRFGADTVKFTYYSDDNNKKGTSLGEIQPKNAGTYWVVATVEATGDYNRIEAEIKFTISKGRVDVTWEGLNDSYTYTGNILGTVGDGGNITAHFAGQGTDGTIDLDVTFTVAYNVLSLEAAHEFRFAGTYTFKADFKSDATQAKNNYTLNSNATKNVTVEKKAVSVDWVGDSCTYEGKVLTEKYPTATADGGKVNFTVTLQGGVPFKNAGRYTFEATWDKNSATENNYIISGETHAFTIQKADLYVGMTATVEYGEATPKATLSYVRGLVGEDAESDSATFIAQAQAAAHFGYAGYTANTGVDQTGTIAVTVSGEIENYNIVLSGDCKLTITRREITVTLTFKNHTYGENPADWVTPTASRAAGGNWYAPGENDISNLSITYTLNGKTYHESLNVPTNTTTADTYTVTATCGNGNYNVTFDYHYADGSEGYVVNKATLSGSIAWTNAEGGEYTGSPYADPTAEIEGVNGKLTLDVERSYDGKGDGKAFKDAGTYTFTASLRTEDAKNYDWGDVNKNKQVTITPAEVTITWGGQTFTYQGKEIKDDLPTAMVNGKKNADDVYATVATNKTFRNAGNYTFTATLTGAAAHNYTIKKDDVTHNYTIGKATLTGSITWSGADPFPYDGTEHADPTATIQGVGTEDGEGGVLTLVVTRSFSDEFKNANKYKFTADLNGDDANNYDWGEVTRETEVTIEQKEISVVDWVKENSYTYQGKKFGDITATFDGVQADGNDLSLTVKMTKFNDVDLETEKDFKDAGKYTFEAEITNSNYKFAEGANKTLEITVAPHTVTAADVTWEDENDKRFTYTGEELAKPWARFHGVGEDAGTTFDLEVSPTDGKTFRDVNNNDYSFKAELKPAQQQNYVLDGDDVNYVIKIYRIAKAKMEAQFAGHMSQVRDTVYHSTENHKINLEMPGEETEEYFLFHRGSAVKKVKGLTFQYIVITHEEDHHTSNPKIPDPGDSRWTEFNLLDIKEAVAPQGYTVFIKATDPNGNYEDFYGWYGVHVAHEELTITLQNNSSGLLPETLEYGDVVLTEATLEEGLKEAILSIVSDEGDMTEEFKRNIENFTFYLRTEDGYNLGTRYSIDTKGVYEGTGTAKFVQNLPVGTYYLFASYVVNGDISQYIVFKWANGRPSFKVTPREISVDVTFKDTTYGEDPAEEGWVTFGTPTRDNDKGGTWYATGEEAKAENLVLLSITYEANGEAFAPTETTDADTYAVTVKCGNGNYKVTFNYAGAHGQNYTVNRKQVTVKINVPTDHLTYKDVGEFTYTLEGIVNGDVITAKLTYSGTSYDGKYNGGDTAPALAGDHYTVTATLEGAKAGNYELKVEGSTETFAIAKATVNEPAKDMNTYTYTGKDQTYEVAASPDIYSVEGNVQKNANETGYKVKIHLLDGNNYQWESGNSDDLTYNFKIMRKDLTVTANGATITYGDDVPAFTVKYDGFVGGEGADDLKGALGFDCTYKRYDDIGSFDITPKGYTSENYKIEFVSGTLQVNAKPVTVTIVKSGNLTYGGFDPEEVFTASFADGDIVNGDPVTPKLTFSGTSYSSKIFEKEPIANLKLAGASYTVTATLDGAKAGNYYISNEEDATTKPFEIKKATVNVTWSGIQPSYTYTGSEFDLPQPSAEGVGGDELAFTVNFKKSPKDVKQFKNAGVYQFTAEMSDADLAFNYILQGSESEEITVDKATVSAPAIDGTVYNGTWQTAEVSDTGEYTVSENNGGKDAGDYDVELTLRDPDNYKWATGEETAVKRMEKAFKIAQKVIESVTWEEKTYTYEGRTFKSSEYPKATFDGVTADGDAIFLNVVLTGSESFRNAGSYTFEAQITDGYEKNYKFRDRQTHDYEIGQAKMRSGFDTAGKMSKEDHDRYFDIEMPPVALRLPEPTAPEFPIVGVGEDTSWAGANLKIYYIVIPHDEDKHDDASIKALLDQLKEEHLPDGKAWVEYTEENAELNVHDAKGYCVYFKIVESGGEGNYETYYDYFSVHIAHEQLTITLTQAARDAFEAGAEYGDVTLTQESLRDGIVDGIAKITDNDNTDRTEEFGKEKTKFTFYFRKDGENGQYYSVDGDGIKDSGGNKVVNLPRGKYYLFVIYNGDAGGKPQRIIFTWTGGRPYFEVIKRKVTVKLTFTSHTYGDADFTDWAEESARIRTTADTADTNWFAPGEEDVDLKLRYALRGIGTPSATTNAKTYEVVTDYDKNGNYEVTFVNAAGGDLTYTVKRATLTVTANGNTVNYGDAPAGNGVVYSGFVNGEGEDVLNKEGLDYDFNYAQYGDVGEYQITPKGLSADNYDFDYKPGTLKVEAKEIEAAWGDGRYTYTGSPFDLPTATAEGLRGDKFTLVVSPDFTGDFMNAGSYFFTAALDGTDTKAKNYTLKLDTTRHSYTVGKATVTAPTIASKVYSGATQAADETSFELGLYAVTENSGGIDAGDYDVILTLIHPENYKWANGEAAEITLTFTITKATYDMSGVTLENVTVTYDAQEHSITITGTLPDGVTVTYEGNGQREVGVYTVTATFTGDARNYEPIDSLQAVLTILEVIHDVSGITFEDVTVKYDGEAHNIYIEGTLPHGVTVAYKNNGQVEPNVYTVTAEFRDPDGILFHTMTATLTILRTHLQAELGDGSGVEFSLDSEDGFDPAVKLVVEMVEEVERNYWAWKKDRAIERYAVKMYKDDVEVSIEGKVTVRLLIPESFRDKAFELMTAEGRENVAYTREGDYVIFEADGLSSYVFTVDSIPYLPILLTATGIAFASVLIMAAMVIVMKKNMKKNKKGDK